MSYEKLGFTSGQTLKAEHLNHMEDGIEAIANNVQIKKIVFTDRPSLWAWLQENYTKIANVKLWTNVSQCVDDMHFIGHGNVGANQPNRFSFYTIYPRNDISQLNLMVSRVEVYSTTCKIYIYCVYDVLSGVAVDESLAQTQEVPDEYWSAMGIEATIYYFD